MVVALKFLGIFFILIAVVKFGIAMFQLWRGRHGRKED